MLHRYTFLVFFLSLLTTLTWWSNRVETSLAAIEPSQGIGNSAKPQPAVDHHELVEALDHLVAYEHYYRSVYGHYTQMVSRLGYSLPSSLLTHFEVRVTEASRERLLITAFTEKEGKALDLATIDQDYQLHASFPVPLPRTEYLKLIALKQLRALRDAPAGQMIEENGIYRGYFRYELKRGLQEGKSAFAVGVRPPVVGMQLELAHGAERLAESEAASGGAGSGYAEEVSTLSMTSTGQNPVHNEMSTLEEAYLAQRIFHGEVGRYAKSWSELSQIAQFRFEDRDNAAAPAPVPFGGAESVVEIDAAAAPKMQANGWAGSSDRVNQELLRRPSSEIKPLEIEPVFQGRN